jgi:hypothetical protein
MEESLKLRWPELKNVKQAHFIAAPQPLGKEKKRSSPSARTNNVQDNVSTVKPTGNLYVIITIGTLKPSLTIFVLNRLGVISVKLTAKNLLFMKLTQKDVLFPKTNRMLLLIWLLLA